MKKILVTGAGGLIGRCACESLAGKYEVNAVVRSEPAEPLPLVRYHALDLSSNWTVDQLPDQVDVVIHLAQSSHFREFPVRARDIFSVNVDATAKLLCYAREAGAKKFILASSGGVYGAGAGSFSENSPIGAHERLGFYLGSKLCAEVLAQNYAELFDVSILRFFFVYGSGQKRSMLMPRLVDSVHNGRAIQLQGKQGIRINPIHVIDAVSALEASIQLEGSHTFNVAGNKVMSLREITDIIAELVGRQAVYEISDSEPQHLHANIDAMSSLLYSPTIEITVGLKELVGGAIN